MADFLKIISLLREQMSATLSRSDALRPLAWLIGILSTAFVAALFAKAQDWILAWLMATLICAIALYALAYVFCLIYDRDALRSERYSLQKLAIEHGIYGDSIVGVVEEKPSPAPATEVKTIEAPRP